MTDQATRLLLIQAAVKLADGKVPTIREMRNILALDGVRVSAITISRDYQQLGFRSQANAGRRRTGDTTVAVKYLRLPVAVYDACCRMAQEQNVKAHVVIRAMVSVGVRHTTPRRLRLSKPRPAHRQTA